MREKRKIIVTGHKNPDTDSICSAIAYSDIKNRTDAEGKNGYEPRRAGEISSETKYVLNRFNMPVPKYIGDVAAQVRDMEIRKTPGVSKDLTLQEAWRIMSESKAVTVPIIENEHIIGVITKGDIAQSFMDSQDNFFLSRAKTKYADIADTIDGKIIVGDGKKRFSKGKVLVGAAVSERMKTVISDHDMVILVDRYENHLIALEKGADCLILCLGVHANDETIKRAAEKDAVIIETDLDTFSVTREINKSAPLEAIMVTDDIVTFKTDDNIDKVKATMATLRHHAFPVIDEKGRYVGTVSRRNMLGIKRKEVILVDHNEKSQAVDNIDEAEILEIIDHHRLGTLETLQPIFFINQPVGCTATILYQMYVEKGLEISPDIAGILCAAIISDTLMFRSPTCTLHDKMAAGALALIADIDIEEFATEMFKAGSEFKDKTAEELFYQDYKKFTFGNTTFGVGQISSMSEEELEVIKGRIKPLIESVLKTSDIDMVFFLFTNIKNSGSEMLFEGERSEDVLLASFENAKKTEDGYFIDGLLSRKKQMIPAFMQALNEV